MEKNLDMDRDRNAGSMDRHRFTDQMLILGTEAPLETQRIWNFWMRENEGYPYRSRPLWLLAWVWLVVKVRPLRRHGRGSPGRRSRELD
jgi:hypothetical protein